MYKLGIKVKEIKKRFFVLRNVLGIKVEVRMTLQLIFQIHNIANFGIKLCIIIHNSQLIHNIAINWWYRNSSAISQLIGCIAIYP